MKSLISGLVLVVALSSFGLAQRGSQQQKPGEPAARPADDQTISVNVDLVNILFTVADRKGKFVTNLRKDDFRVFEDERPQAITNFSERPPL